MAIPAVFDRSLVRRRLARAVDAGYADFLLARAVADLDERLGTVARRFSVAADLGTPTGAAATLLRRRVERVVRVAPLPERGAVQGDVDRLPLAGERFDLAVSLLALQAVDDVPGALVQIRRALRPDGLFVGCLLGGASLGELRQALTLAEAEVEGGASPRVAPFADVRDLGNLLQRAGFALPVADAETVRVRYPDPIALMRDLRAMGLTNPLRERSRRPLRRKTLARAVELYGAMFGEADGRVPATFEFVWLSGWAPHASQQKPLQPGSAKMRLAEALGVPEHSAVEKPR